jgi:hypothetical protein
MRKLIATSTVDDIRHFSFILLAYNKVQHPGGAGLGGAAAAPAPAVPSHATLKIQIG